MMKTITILIFISISVCLRAQDIDQQVNIAKDTLAANQPLLIVDGVKLNKDGISLSTAMSKINPNDIDYLEVLKGDSAIAQYGDRGRKGVILVNLKSAHSKKKSKP